MGFGSFGIFFHPVVFMWHWASVSFWNVGGTRVKARLKIMPTFLEALPLKLWMLSSRQDPWISQSYDLSSNYKVQFPCWGGVDSMTLCSLSTTGSSSKYSRTSQPGSGRPNTRLSQVVRGDLATLFEAQQSHNDVQSVTQYWIRCSVPDAIQSICETELSQISHEGRTECF